MAISSSRAGAIDAEVANALARIVGSHATVALAWERIAGLVIQAGIRAAREEELLACFRELLVDRARTAFEAAFDAIDFDSAAKARAFPRLIVDRILSSANADTATGLRGVVRGLRREIRRVRRTPAKSGRPRRASDEAIREYYDGILSRLRDPVEDFRVGVPRAELKTGKRALDFAASQSAADLASALDTDADQIRRTFEKNPKLMAAIFGRKPEAVAKWLTAWAFSETGRPLSDRTVERALAWISHHSNEHRPADFC
ncbi:hypothetical protein FJY94_09585 [Candidatus Kaiserbacteria bacterium]|nr:hypothetical protein [Candidatus Kaiserbacteria bacterium]